MCGIVGIFSYSDSAPPVVPEEILKIRDAMKPRGPDGAGLWISADGRAFSIPVPQWLAEAEDHSELSRQLGLRGWARLVYRHHTGGPA